MICWSYISAVGSDLGNCRIDILNMTPVDDDNVVRVVHHCIFQWFVFEMIGCRERQTLVGRQNQDIVFCNLSKENGEILVQRMQGVINNYHFASDMDKWPRRFVENKWHIDRNPNDDAHFQRHYETGNECCDEWNYIDAFAVPNLCNFPFVHHENHGTDDDCG